MNKTNYFRLDEIEPFKDLSLEGKEKLEKNIEILKYNIGQPILIGDKLPNSIIVICEGEARLINNDGKQTQSICKFNKGSILGLGSLLRADPCESINAATTLTAYSIPDTIILDLYSSEKSFSKKLNNISYPGEILELVKILMSQSNRTDINIKSAFNQVLLNNKVITLENKEKISTLPNDYYHSNVIARASKTMNECRSIRTNLKKTGTEG